ncbi:hypothetical protein D3C87_2083600 [compost metagenome]
MLRCQPVIDGDQLRLCRMGNLGADGIMTLQRTDDKTAAVNIENPCLRRDICRPVAANRNAIAHHLVLSRQPFR